MVLDTQPSDYPMTPYLQRAFKTYCDTTQTLIARDIAKDVLLNAGFSHFDLQRALAQGVDSLEVYLFAA